MCGMFSVSHCYSRVCMGVLHVGHSHSHVCVCVCVCVCLRERENHTDICLMISAHLPSFTGGRMNVAGV